MSPGKCGLMVHQTKLLCQCSQVHDRTPSTLVLAQLLYYSYQLSPELREIKFQ